MTAKSGELALFGGPRVLEADTHRRWPIIEEEERAAVMRPLDRGVLSGMFAPEAAAFEREFAAFAGVKHAQLTHSGTSALQLALKAVGGSALGKVVVPAYTFVATAMAVLLEGGTPIFADVDALSGNIDPASAEAVAEGASAIMPVHVHGCPCDVDEMMGVAKKHGAVLIEDAAQAHGATYKGRPVGTFGAAAGFSLQSSKNLSAGEGGVVVTQDDEIANVIRECRTFGQDVRADDADAYDPKHPLDGHRPLASLRVGSMYRGNEMMAAFARAQLAKLPARTAAAQASYERLRAGLAELEGVLVPKVPSDRTSVHHKVRVHFDPKAAGLDCGHRQLRDAMHAALAAEGLEITSWQSEPVPAQALFRALSQRNGVEGNYDPARYPNARLLLDRSIVVFTQSCPLIAQTRATVDAYVEAFRKVWPKRGEIVKRFAS